MDGYCTFVYFRIRHMFFDAATIVNIAIEMHKTVVKHFVIIDDNKQ